MPAATIAWVQLLVLDQVVNLQTDMLRNEPASTCEVSSRCEKDRSRKGSAGCCCCCCAACGCSSACGERSLPTQSACQDCNFRTTPYTFRIRAWMHVDCQPGLTLSVSTT